jgi:FG-GAP-like repeat
LRQYIIILGSLFIFACKQYNRNQSHKEIPNSSIEAGEMLAKKYCQSCHAFPEPSLLDVNSWDKGVLPNMGPRLGIFNFNWDQYPSMRRDRNLPADYYPSQPLLTADEWHNILNYYLATAPDSLPPQQRPYPIKNDLSIFSVSAPAITRTNPTTCFIQVDTTQLPHTLLQSDIFRKSVIRYDRNLQPVDSFPTSGPVVDIDFRVLPQVATNIGQLNPTNARLGKLETILLQENGKMFLDSTMHIDSLQRPVQSIRVDLNADGKPDELVCEFGHLTGALSWYENTGDDHHYIRHVLRPVPGAIKAYIKDYNRDGLPDLIVLFAQGEEGIFLFTNRGHGQFDQKQILRFPPSYGSSSFELDDFNNDGYPDILYTCGDNADFSKVLKPYHGVYIFLNDGQWNFNQKYFFPINGCYKAMARDFDGDGDLDLAVISFFADYQKQPEEGFVYLENKGDFNFMPHSMPETQQGRWLTMDVGDLDGDGKPDIFLGNFSIAPSFIKSPVPWDNAPSFLYLKNISVRK